jgi:hypothetical protein
MYQHSTNLLNSLLASQSSARRRKVLSVITMVKTKPITMNSLDSFTINTRR